jgi:hypothetical protein
MNGLSAHLHGGLVESAERMQTHADDGYVIGHRQLPF